MENKAYFYLLYFMANFVSLSMRIIVALSYATAHPFGQSLQLFIYR